MYVISAVYIIFSILVYHFVSCDWPSRFVPVRVSRVIKKQPPLRHIKAFPGIKISHEPGLTTIPPSSHRIHPSIHLSAQSSVYPGSQLSISSLAFRINA